ncbi:MAG: PAS domain-containing protein [Kiritimatiellia bacterium]|nr:PAS domain-containing protein [Lentisphaerota bacterium]
MMREYAILRDMPVPVMLIDNELRVLEVSRSLLVLLTLGHVQGDHVRNCQTMADWLAGQDDLGRLLKDGAVGVGRSGGVARIQWQHEGRPFLLTVADALQGADGDSVFFVHAEEQIGQPVNQRGSCLKSIMSSLCLGIIVVDKGLCVTHLNRMQENFLQCAGCSISLMQAMGMRLDELLPDEAGLLEKITGDVLQEGAVYGGIVEQLTATDGRELVYNLSFYPLRDEHNTIFGMLRVCEDVTEKAKLEENLRQAEAQALELARVRKEIGVLNHSLNNVLMIVVGNGEVLLRLPPPLPEGQRELVGSMLEQADKITAITRKLESLQRLKTDCCLDDGARMVAADGEDEPAPGSVMA